MERKLQSKIIKFLKDQGGYVIKTRPQPGIPVGIEDVICLYREKWCAIEVKASENAPFRPGQQATLQYHKKGNKFVYVAYPENWELIRAELLAQFF